MHESGCAPQATSISYGVTKFESTTATKDSVGNRLNLATVTRLCQAAFMSWQHVRIGRFGGPEVLELAEESTIPNPGPGEVCIKVLAAGTGFTDSPCPNQVRVV
jgi:hypothetical protein